MSTRRQPKNIASTICSFALGLADFNHYGPEELVANNFPQSVADEGADGPKWFLQIAEGDEVTVLCDTERNLFDWAQQGTFYLMGIIEQVVFEPFPVEWKRRFQHDQKGKEAARSRGG